jgi:hypothetical protein
VLVRLLGDVALVHARTTFRDGGRPGHGRYTDVWARRAGRWMAIAAHVTRCWGRDRYGTVRSGWPDCSGAGGGHEA